MTATVVTRSIGPLTSSSSGGISRPGHAWVEIRFADGTVESYGYYPTTQSWTADGKVVGNDAASYAGKGFTSDPIPITQDQVGAFRTFASSTDAFGNWTLPGGSAGSSSWNCATWAFGAFDFADVDGRFAARTFLP